MRKAITILLVISTIITAMGCSNTEGVKTVEKGIETNTVNSESSDVQVKKKEINLNLVKEEAGTSYCSNERGFYYIDKRAEGFKLKDGTEASPIMYVDYSTRKEVFLCNNSGCKHDTEACTAVISGKDLTMDQILFLHNGSLYLLIKNYDMEGTSSINMNSDGDDVENEKENKSQILYKMKADGTDRKKVYEFEKGITVDDLVIQDNNSLYFIIKKLETKKSDNNMTYNTVSEKRLIKIDDSTGKDEKVCDLNIGDEKSSWNIVGCFGTKVIIDGYIEDHKLSDEERKKDIEDADFSRELSSKSKTEFATVDIITGDVKKICSFSNKEFCNGHVTVDNCLYYMLDGKKKIYTTNLETGEENILTEFTEKGISILKKFSDALCCDNWGQEREKYFYFVNIKDGKVSKSSLTTKTLGWPIEFLGETKDKCLVIYDYDAKKSGIDDESYDISQNKFALIDKEDLYKGKENFKPIEMIGSGLID